MSVYAVNEKKVELQVATNQGFGQYGRWAESLPTGQFPEVVALWIEGLSNDAPKLAGQLQAAQKVREPHADVKDIIQHVLQVCEGAQHVMMTNGLVMGEEE